MKELKRVLLTGASGFIGRYTIAPLLSRGYEIHGVGRTSSANLDGCIWHSADLLDPTIAKHLVNAIRPTHLLHLAWYTDHGKYWTSPQNLDWLAASIGLLKAFAASEGSRVVIAGSCAEYDWRYGFCNEELTSTNPWSLYGVSKHSLQITSSAFARENGLSFAWGRIFFPFGPGEHQERLIPSTILSLLQQEPAHCTHGEQIRDYIYVEDVADALVTLLDSDICSSVNIGSGIPVAVKDLVGTIAKKIGQESLLELGALPARKDEPHMVVADIANLKTKLGWSPKHNLNVGIEKSIEWWKTRTRECAFMI